MASQVATPCTVSGGVRAYFAPVDRLTATPAEFEITRCETFELDAPGAPWIDAGAIEHFSRTPGTAIEAVRCGPKAAPVAQFRQQLEARVEFDFLTWGKLQMAIAGGAESINLLAVDDAGVRIAPVGVLEPSTATELNVGAEAVAAFAAGNLIAVDVDYTGETGYVGSGIAGGFVRDAESAPDDRDYVRRITFNLARVASVGDESLTLATALPAGAPVPGMALQKVCGFCDREGGRFFQEFSALFIVPEDGGARLCFYYPRVQAAAPASEQAIELAAPLRARVLHASLRALPVADADGESVLCYRAVFPAIS